MLTNNMHMLKVMQILFGNEYAYYVYGYTYT